MNIAIIGAGAMGSIIGGMLASARENVVLVDPWREHVDAINARGLTIDTEKGSTTTAVRATPALTPSETVDLAVILVKSYHTRDAVEALRPHLAANGSVLSLQNGLGNEETVAEIIGPSRTFGGSLNFGGNVVGPGHVKCSNSQGEVYVGALDKAARPRADAIAALFAKASFNAKSHPDILAVKWNKAFVNVAINALVSIVDEPNRVAGEKPLYRKVMIAACAEALAVAKKKGIHLIGGDEPEQYVSSGVDTHSYQHRASMCIDLRNGKKTEIEFMNGAIERFGAELGVSTPINTLLTASVRRIEKERSG